MQRISFNEIELEITRRCQLKCAHCMRGDAQDIDMSYEIIDRLLEQVKSIDSLVFTGGEPTLNLDGMKYFLDKLIENNIHLGRMSYITNGVLMTQDIIDVIRGYYDWIEHSDNHSKVYISIGVSDDRYHVGVDVQKAIQYYSDNLASLEHIFAAAYRAGEYVQGKGRGKTLPEARYLDEDYIDRYYFNSRIEVLKPGKPYFCPYRKYEEIDSDGDARVLCTVSITAIGNMANIHAAEYELEDSDKYNKYNIMSGDIVSIIEKYNKGRNYCIVDGILREVFAMRNVTMDIFAGIKADHQRSRSNHTSMQNPITHIKDMLDRQSKYEENEDKLLKAIDLEQYPLEAQDYIDIYNDLRNYLDEQNADYYKQHPDIAALHILYPDLSKKECEDLRHYRLMWDKYHKSNEPRYKAVAKEMMKRINEITRRGNLISEVIKRLEANKDAS